MTPSPPFLYSPFSDLHRLTSYSRFTLIVFLLPRSSKLLLLLTIRSRVVDPPLPKLRVYYVTETFFLIITTKEVLDPLPVPLHIPPFQDLYLTCHSYPSSTVLHTPTRPYWRIVTSSLTNRTPEPPLLWTLS